ncbi:selenocysteine lyase-like [Lytechinus pictus]|uniref:selenocysteine lyase-like n=1 Tax=Lytechinus pictus TaxID=7653 RepID=UPI0030BA0843
MSVAQDQNINEHLKRKAPDTETHNGKVTRKVETADDALSASAELIYLDYNATTPVEPEVIEVISETLSAAWGNPSSSYPQGQLAKQLINKARSQVATMVGASPSDIIFTSGGTEANNLVIHTAIEHFKNSVGTSSSVITRPHIVTSNLEHDSIKLPLEHLVNQGIADVTFVPASIETGRVEAHAIIDAVQPTTCLVTIMHANNETGVIQPVEEIFQRLKGMTHDPPLLLPRILLHTDAAQTIGKIRVDVDDLNADYLTIVGHKFYAPRIGALYVRGLGDSTIDRGAPLYPMLFGGGQERNFRPGTENTAMIAGLGKAAEIVTENVKQFEDHMRRVRDYLEERIESTFPGQVCFNGKCKGSERIPNTCNVSFLGRNRQGRKILLKAKRFQASVGAACHSHAGDRPSHILIAIGVPNEVAVNALRLSVGRHTTTEEVDMILKDLQDSLKTLDSEVDS